jgi:hypothetical protein
MTLFCDLASAEPLEQYICIGEQATGFNWDGKRWVSASFNTANEKFLVQEIQPERDVLGDEYNVVVKKFGENRNMHTCKRETFRGTKVPQFVCGGLGYGMVINTKSLRYQEYYGLGYVDGDDKPGNTPSITIGRCTRLH